MDTAEGSEGAARCERAVVELGIAAKDAIREDDTVTHQTKPPAAKLTVGLQ